MRLYIISFVPQEQEHPSEPIESLSFNSLNRLRNIGKADNPMLRSALAFAGGGIG